MSHTKEGKMHKGTTQGHELHIPHINLVTHPELHVGDLEDNKAHEGNVSAADHKHIKGKADSKRVKRNIGRR